MKRREDVPARCEPNPGGGRVAGWLLGLSAIILGLVAGCGMRSDGWCCPCAHLEGDPTVMERAEEAVGKVGAALDKLDERLENTVW